VKSRNAGLLYAETVRKEIDDMPAKKSGKNVERRLLDTWRHACDEMKYPAPLELGTIS